MNKPGVLLIPIDSVIPNLALMKIATWKKEQGYNAGFNVSDPVEIYASIVFKKNAHKADGLKYIYPGAKIDVGGSGVSLTKSLPAEVDLMKPDYTLYPNWDYDLGFTTRGCIRHCPFCIVPKKEGSIRMVQHPREFHDPAHKKIMLLDNNILAVKDWFMEVSDWVKNNHLTVDFNQGLDARLMDKEIAETIAELKTDTLKIAFDNMNYKTHVLRAIDLLNNAGVKCRNRLICYVYLDSDADFNDALTRCNILVSKGVTPYVMINQDATRTPRMTDLKRWCRPWFCHNIPFNDYLPNRSKRVGENIQPPRLKNGKFTVGGTLDAY